MSQSVSKCVESVDEQTQIKKCAYVASVGQMMVAAAALGQGMNPNLYSAAATVATGGTGAASAGGAGGGNAQELVTPKKKNGYNSYTLFCKERGRTLGFSHDEQSMKNRQDWKLVSEAEKDDYRKRAAALRQEDSPGLKTKKRRASAAAEEQ